MSSTSKKEKKPERQSFFEDGPHLLCAIVCETLLTEPNGVKTAVRIVDRFQHAILISGESAPIPPTVVEKDLFLLVKFKKGDDAGDKHELKLRMLDPDGQLIEPFETSQTIQFEGGPNRGLDFVMRLHLKLEKEGIHWIDILLDEVRLTRVPLELVIVIRRQRRAGESPTPVQ